MKFIKLLQEGRVEDFSNKFSNKFSQNQITQIIELSKRIPGNNKYLMWLGNVLDPTNFDGVLEKLEEVLPKFDNISNNLDRKDINQYRSVEDLLDVLDKNENKSELKREIKKGADVVYEDDNFLVISPKTHEASCYYGAGTKWCTTMRDDPSPFKTYTSKGSPEEGALFYFLDKKKPTSDDFYKVALHYRFIDRLLDFRKPNDKKIMSGWLLGTNYLKGILGKINEYIKSNYSERLDHFEKKREENREAGRQRNYREVLVNDELMSVGLNYNSLLSQSYHNRDALIWPYSYDQEYEGKYAWALYTHLLQSGQIDGHTIDEIIEMQEYSTRYSELEHALEEDEENIEIEWDLKEIAEILEEYNDKPDVYNLVVISNENYPIYRFLNTNDYTIWEIGKTSEISDEYLNEYDGEVKQVYYLDTYFSVFRIL
jgi:hypothetical protein